MTRRPARRRPNRGSRPRKQKGSDFQFLLVIGLIGIWASGFLMSVQSWLADHLWVLALPVAALAGTIAMWMHLQKERARQEATRAQGLRYVVEHLDGLHYTQFEYAVRDLLRRDGCQDAEQVGRGGDQGADVKATDPFGRRWVIQCKHRKDGWSGSAVGTPDLQRLNGTGRQIHNGDVIVMLTNGRFSKQAPGFAKSQRLHLVDRHLLAQWANGSRPLWELLRAVPPPRNKSSKYPAAQHRSDRGTSSPYE
ncbi:MULTISPECIES: restriction endonuclease [unclassified Streptomyces]|uniref:restriction endonuclease n=1 Tax=unclassified Streptomyces TaxID=2593676 RepID=UPI00325614EA